MVSASVVTFDAWVLEVNGVFNFGDSNEENDDKVKNNKINIL